MLRVEDRLSGWFWCLLAKSSGPKLSSPASFLHADFYPVRTIILSGNNVQNEVYARQSIEIWKENIETSAYIFIFFYCNLYFCVFIIVSKMHMWVYMHIYIWTHTHIYLYIKYHIYNWMDCDFIYLFFGWIVIFFLNQKMGAKTFAHHCFKKYMWLWCILSLTVIKSWKKETKLQ